MAAQRPATTSTPARELTEEELDYYLGNLPRRPGDKRPRYTKPLDEAKSIDSLLANMTPEERATLLQVDSHLKNSSKSTSQNLMGTLTNVVIVVAFIVLAFRLLMSYAGGHSFAGGAHVRPGGRPQQAADGSDL
eukprot:a5174_68.p2 GENE.a5174_68~~a5174_68.p2  ORF type:complete len:149 (-),score=1.28 a5174_68:784-1185(-)